MPMKKTLLRSSLREIRQAPGRFLSILGIIFLGVAFFVGISATGPNMKQAAEDYFSRQQLADLTIASTLGLSDTDRQIIEEMPGVKAVETEQIADINAENHRAVIRVFSLSTERPVNQYEVTSGRLPQKSGEIALDQAAQNSGSFELNESFELPESGENQLKTHTFTIVGFVNSPEYIENFHRGNSTVGNGTVDYFAVIPEEDFKESAYARILVRFDDLSQMESYSEAYQTNRDQISDEVEKKLAPRAQGRRQELIDEAQPAIDEAKEQIRDGEKALQEAQRELDDAQEKLAQAHRELTEQEAAFQTKIQAAQEQLTSEAQKIAEGKQALAENQRLLDQSEQALLQQEAQVKSAQDQLAPILAQKTELQNGVQQVEEQLALAYQGMDQIKSVGQLSAEEQMAQLPAVYAQVTAALAQLNLPTDVIGPIPDLEEIDETMIATMLTAAEDALNPLITEGEQQRAQLSAQLAAINEQEAQLQQAQQQVNAGWGQISAGRQEFAQAQTQITQGESQLSVARETLASEQANGRSLLDKGWLEYQENEATLQEKLAEFKERAPKEREKLEDAKKEVAEKEQELLELKPAVYRVANRDANPGYSEYQDNAERVSSLATIFPVIFFLIAALVSLTTMTRMIDEKRSEIGTLKALGYRNWEIGQKFLLYSSAAGITGAVLGLAVGFSFFPAIIIQAYGPLYNLTEYDTPWYLRLSLIAVGVSLLCTIGIALLVLRFDLRQSSASLLRPKAPKTGKRILLERITFLWRHLSFIQKVTMRNLFRYKSRMLMTILGIAGCTSMILTGFGLRDSISNIIPLQFEKIWQYQAVITFDDEDSQAMNETKAAAEEIDGFDEGLFLHTESLTLAQPGVTQQEVTVTVPEDPAALSRFVHLNDRVSGEAYELGKDGAIINEKLAKLFGLSVGDTLTLTNESGEEFQLEVAAIAENYTGHFAYLTPEMYEKVFQETPSYNSELLKFNQHLSKTEEESIAADLMAQDNIINVSFLSASADALDDTTATLNIVIWILISSAGALAFIVLYNLNNINIAERIRELSTIKVLGFYDREVTMYVFRENIFLTIFGIGFGLLLGVLQHQFVLQTIEVDIAMFSPTVEPMSYVYAAGLTCLFSGVVGIAMYFKLKHVNMIDALKANE